MFPQNWEVSERIAVQFCHNTREELAKLMAKRKNEIDVKLLLFAIQKTAAFENLLARRFTGVTITEGQETKPKTESSKELTNASINDIEDTPFHNIIGQCFIPHLDIYIESVDRNLADLIER